MPAVGVGATGRQRREFNRDGKKRRGDKGSGGYSLPPWRILYSLDSYRSWGCFVFTDSCCVERDGARSRQRMSRGACERVIDLEQNVARLRLVLLGFVFWNAPGWIGVDAGAHQLDADLLSGLNVRACGLGRKRVGQRSADRATRGWKRVETWGHPLPPLHKIGEPRASGASVPAGAQSNFAGRAAHPGRCLRRIRSRSCDRGGTCSPREARDRWTSWTGAKP